MNHARNEILQWAKQGHLNPADLPGIFAANGITPQRQDWRALFDRITLWLGTIFLAAGVIFFVAWNWNDMGRFAKFALLQCLILVSLLPLWRFGIERVEAKAALVLSSLLIGSLFALIGQTYQTGADPYELFVAWALAIFPLVLVARFAPLWLVWLILLNLGLHQYFTVFSGIGGATYASLERVWAMFALNVVAWACSEAVLHKTGLRKTLTGAHNCSRAVLVYCVFLLTVAVGSAIFDRHSDQQGFAHPFAHPIVAVFVYPAWLGLMYHLYRQRWPDLLILASNALSLIVVTTLFLSEMLLKNSSGNELVYLLIGVIVLVLSGLAGMWLKNLARELRL